MTSGAAAGASVRDGNGTGGAGAARWASRKSPRTVSQLLLAVFLAWAGGVAAQPAPSIVRTEATALADFPTAVDVYQPSFGPSRGLAVVAHGFTRSRERHRDLGRDLAGEGIVAVIPDLPWAVDHWANGDAIVELVAKLEAGALGLAPVERSRMVLIGTSAGGLTTLLAAAKLPGLAGWIGLDPVDRTGTGADAAAQLTAPAVVLLAERSSCNLYGSGKALGRAVPRLLRSKLLEGASHCDFESPTNNFCRFICGRSPPGTAELAREETVDAALEMLDIATLRRSGDRSERAD